LEQGLGPLCDKISFFEAKKQCDYVKVIACKQFAEEHNGDRLPLAFELKRCIGLSANLKKLKAVHSNPGVRIVANSDVRTCKCFLEKSAEYCLLKKKAYMTDEYPILFEITDRKGNNPVNDL
jgi:hypothetical protein